MVRRRVAVARGQVQEDWRRAAGDGMVWLENRLQWCGDRLQWFGDRLQWLGVEYQGFSETSIRGSEKDCRRRAGVTQTWVSVACRRDGVARKRVAVARRGVSGV